MLCLLTPHLNKQARTKPCKNSQLDAQIIASEPDGQVSKSDVQQVALYTHKSGGSQLVVPRKPFPMTNKSLEKFMLWLDWTRTFNKYVVCIVQGIAVSQQVSCLHCCCSRHCCVTISVLSALLQFKLLLYHSQYVVCIVAVQDIAVLRAKEQCQEAEKCAVCIVVVSVMAVLCAVLCKVTISRSREAHACKVLLDCACLLHECVMLQACTL